MASNQKPPRRRRNGFLDGPDQINRLNSMYRSRVFDSSRTRMLTNPSHAAFDDMASPEPGEELDDSEISERERREAIARERMRRQGRT